MTCTGLTPLSADDARPCESMGSPAGPGLPGTTLSSAALLMRAARTMARTQAPILDASAGRPTSHALAGLTPGRTARLAGSAAGQRLRRTGFRCHRERGGDGETDSADAVGVTCDPWRCS